MTVEARFSSISVCSLFHSSSLTFHSMLCNHGRTLIGFGIRIACYDWAYAHAMCLLLSREAHACTSFSNKDPVLVTKSVLFHYHTPIHENERELYHCFCNSIHMQICISFSVTPCDVGPSPRVHTSTPLVVALNTLSLLVLITVSPPTTSAQWLMEWRNTHSAYRHVKFSKNHSVIYRCRYIMNDTSNWRAQLGNCFAATIWRWHITIMEEGGTECKIMGAQNSNSTLRTPCTCDPTSPHIPLTWDMMTHKVAFRMLCQSWQTHQSSLHRKFLNEPPFLSWKKVQTWGREVHTPSASWRPPYDISPTQFFMLFNTDMRITVWHVILRVIGVDFDQNEYFSVVKVQDRHWPWRNFFLD